MIAPSRRSFLRVLLSLPIAATLDVEKLLWTPSPIVVVPTLSLAHTEPNIGEICATIWERQFGALPADNIFSSRTFFHSIGKYYFANES
jgi:hypothetical protein